MHKPENLEVIGIDASAPNKILVATQCSGSCYEQNYPKQIRHSFKFDNKYLAKHEDGEYHFIKKMRKMYTSKEVNIGNVEKTEIKKSFDDKVEELNEELSGKII